MGLGTQIQRLENDASEEGREPLNSTSHDAVVAALQAGYRHLDTAHGYYNEDKVVDSMSIRDRLRQKEQFVKEREANRVHQTKQKDRGAR